MTKTELSMHAALTVTSFLFHLQLREFHSVIVGSPGFLLSSRSSMGSEYPYAMYLCPKCGRSQRSTVSFRSCLSFPSPFLGKGCCVQRTDVHLSELLMSSCSFGDRPEIELTPHLEPAIGGVSDKGIVNTITVPAVLDSQRFRENAKLPV
jgi:hypothetical protein